MTGHLAVDFFVHESPLTTARRAAEADLTGKATPGEVQWLNDNPLLWLRSLIRIRAEVRNHIAKDRRSIANLKPAAGTHPEGEYLRAKAELDQRSVGRLHFIQRVEGRIEDVKVIVGGRPLGDRMLIGDLVEIFASIADAVEDGDLRAAHDKARFWADRLAATRPSRTEEA